MTPIYINGIGSIQPQVEAVQEANPFVCVEPDYKQYLDPSAVRRLSKLIKRTLVASKLALTEAEIEIPDAIITGTGLGCLEDTEKFLNSVLEDELGMLSPTAFIQSTHNTLSGQVALMLKCHGYNTTYAQRSHSFEQAVEDAVMMLEAKEAQHILVGAADEIPPNTHRILQKIGLYRSVQKHSELPIAGEGVHYFVFSTQKTSHSKARLLASTYFSGTINIQQEVESFLTPLQLHPSSIDLMILGRNGQPTNDNIYQKLLLALPHSGQLHYKHLTGESFTASAFGWKLASDYLVNASVGEPFLLKMPSKEVKNILLYNHFQNTEHSLALLQHV
jgi:hypothetical protein